MENSKFFALLQEMSPTERNALLKFLNSPYLNPNEKLAVLGERILDLFRLRPDNIPDKHTIWQDCFPNTPFKDETWRRYLNQLVNLVELFYSIENIKSDDLASTYHALDQSANRFKKKMLKHSSEKYEKLYRFNQYFSVKKTIFAYLAESLLYKHIHENDVRYKESNLKRVIYLLNSLYYSEYLKQISHAKTRDWEHGFHAEFHLNFIDQAISSEPDIFEKHPAILIYKKILISIEDKENIENFNTLRKLITEYVHLFDPLDGKTLYEWLINFCIIKINRGESHFLKELFEIYKEFVMSDLILEDGILHDYNFKNIVIIGLRLKEFQWVEYFIETYGSKLPPAKKESAISYNLAQYNFYRKNFSAVLDLLREVDYDDLTYNTGAKAILMATYYELDELEPLYSMFDSFKVYLNRKQNKIPDHFRKEYLNFIKFLKQLIDLRPGDQKAIEQFQAKLKSTGNVASFNWLLQKSEELK